MGYEIVRLTSKGQMTIPVSIRRQLRLREGDNLIVAVEGNTIRLQKLEPVRPLDENDPIWGLIGSGESGLSDVAENHDRYLAPC
ncbi:MAG: AbrB/MazE/SpoVT family DNA-binding domain-containing protein [Desulforudis sp.]|nr:AbrB/MazE/SpoVT family DNA-binding domain-containing protein [Bacillota bacterium]MDZ7609911.1 AbrB/MazE/SpoVT family DNA-binding domain-containing protein [Eubacteriales bacterium]RJX19658.1 MAG: AbrB/MazE/SpoVT family DNA-binding domain-containing protein [Desulforudis sp.]